MRDPKFPLGTKVRIAKVHDNVDDNDPDFAVTASEAAALVGKIGIVDYIAITKPDTYLYALQSLSSSANGIEQADLFDFMFEEDELEEAE